MLYHISDSKCIITFKKIIHCKNIYHFILRNINRKYISIKTEDSYSLFKPKLACVREGVKDSMHQVGKAGSARTVMVGQATFDNKNTDITRYLQASSKVI